ncbi:TonB-dependent receptor [Erythrobacter sp. W53]|uniref:TonB-dependent receptor n=1 Tax=Erythrobacter sp. W53 TaxID=3425947 RepID=UPI003D766F0F
MSKFNSKLLHTTAATALLVASQAGIANAQDVGPEEEANEEVAEPENVIVVSGIRGSILNSINDKRNSGQIVDTINAEDIGKSTDQNIAEALNRVSGVSIATQDGEGTTISVRGANADQTVVTLNGSVLGSTGFSQGVDLSSYSADILEKVEVVKTPSADDEEGSLAAVVNLVTRKPLDIADNVRTATIQGRYNDLSENYDHKFSATFSQKFAEDRLGILVSVFDETNSVRRDSFFANSWNVFGTNGYTDPSGQSFVAQAAIDADQIAATRNGRDNAFIGATGVTANGADFNPYAQIATGLAPSQVGYQLLQTDRDRRGFDASLQWEPSDRFNITVSGTYAKQKFNNRLDGTGVDTNNFQQHIDGVQQPNLFLPPEFIDRSGSDPNVAVPNFATGGTFDPLIGVYDASPTSFGGTAADFTGSLADVTNPTLNDQLLWTDPVHQWRTFDPGTNTFTRYWARHAQGNNQSSVNRFENENYLISADLEWQPFDNVYAKFGGSFAKSEQTPDVNIFVAAGRGRTIGPWNLHHVPADILVPAGYDCGDGSTCQLNGANFDPFLGNVIDLQANLDDLWDNIGRTGYNPDDLASHTLGFIQSSVVEVEDKQDTLYADFDWETDFVGVTSFEFGAKYTRREKFVNNQSGTPRPNQDLVEAISPFTGDTIFLDPSNPNLIQAALFADGQLPADNFGSGIGLARDFATDGWTTFDPEAALAVVTDDVRDFTINGLETRSSEYENWAAYAKANFEYLEGRLRGDIGLRYVRTEVDTFGFAGAAFQFDNGGQGRILDPIYLNRLRNSDQGNLCPVLSETPSPVGLGDASAFWAPLNGSTDVNNAANYDLAAFQARNAATRIDGQGSAPAVPGGVCYDPLLEPGALPLTFRERNLVRYSDLSTEQFSNIPGIDIPTDRSLPSLAATDSYSYDVWLPSLNLSFLATDDLILRFSAYRTMSRPPIDDVRAGFSLTEGSVFEGSLQYRPGSNLNLNTARIDPLVADNLDFAVEWYFAKDALLSANFFYKDISDLIERTETRVFLGDLRRIAADPENSSIDGLTFTDPDGVTTDLILGDFSDTGFTPDIASCFPRRIQGEANIGLAEEWLFGGDPRALCNEFQLSRQENAESASITGIELQYIHNFNFLPGLLSGLGISANYTFQEGKFNDEEEFPIPGTPRHSYNITGYWQDDNGNQLRLAYSGNSDRLLNRNFGGIGALWEDGRQTLDFSAAYKVNDNFTLTFDAVNITDEPIRQYFTSRTALLTDADGNTFTFNEGTISDGAYQGRTTFKANTGTIFRAGVKVDF